MTKETPEAKTDKQYLPLEADFENWTGESVTLTFRFAKPTKMQIERTNKEVQKNKVDRGFKNLLVSLVHPDEKDKFLEATDEYPGLVTSLSDAIYAKLGYASVGK
jgi:hypothetical protein